MIYFKSQMYTGQPSDNVQISKYFKYYIPKTTGLKVSDMLFNPFSFVVIGQKQYKVLHLI